MTPEATKRVIEKDAPQLALLMGLKSLEKTKFAVLSRAVCGIRKGTLIINLPGSKKAVEECFLSICDVLPHAVDVITDKTKCVRETHKDVQGTNGVKRPAHKCPHETGDGSVCSLSMQICLNIHSHMIFTVRSDVNIPNGASGRGHQVDL